MSILLMKKLRPQGFRPGKNGVDRIPRESDQGLNFNHGKSSLGLQLWSRDTGWGEAGQEGGLPGWELEEEESKSERTLALGPAVCLGHGFLIIKLSLKGELGAQGRFLLSYGRVLSPTKEPEQSIY